MSEEAGVTLSSRLRARREEIEAAILARAHSLSDPSEVGDPAYVEGLRQAVSAAVALALGCAESETSIPPALLSQARHAARDGVSVDTVLRRYFAGYTLLGDFVMKEAGEDDRFDAAEVHRLREAHAALLDRLLVAVAAAHAEEAERRAGLGEARRVARVKAMLAGELLDSGEPAYDLGAWHVGAIASGPGAGAAVRSIASVSDSRLLAVRPGGETVWAWLGGRRRASAQEVAELVARSWPSEVSLVLGDPARGLAGWRLTHRQAKAALRVAVREDRPIVTYREVALLASVLRDGVLAASLRDSYLSPLEAEKDGGMALRQTLRAYLRAGRSISSAAMALGVSRKTVNNRLAVAEERIGQSLEVCAVELETALRLHELEHRSVANLAPAGADSEWRTDGTLSETG